MGIVRSICDLMEFGQFFRQRLSPVLATLVYFLGIVGLDDHGGQDTTETCLGR